MSGGFPDDVSLGTLLEVTTTGWQRWFDARGPVSLVGRAIALDASAAALSHLAELPPELRGLSLAGLSVNDADLPVIVDRLQLLTWLDLRGTAVTAEAVNSLRRLHRLRYLGLDEAVATAARLRSGPTAFGFRAGVTVVTEGAQLVPSHSGLPEPDVAGFNDLLASAVTAHPGLSGSDVAEAGTRAAVLLDAGRPEQALAVLASTLTTGDPALVLVAARCANEIGTTAQALAALTLGPPTGEILAWRAIFLSRTAAAEAVAVAQVALREAPGDLAALWAICSSYLNAGQFELAERTLADLEVQRPGWPDTAKLAARLARGRRRYGDEIAAWNRVLAQQPDDADALAGLARAQRSARPLSMTWMTTLNSAATADVDRHGESFLEQVTRHRRQLARLGGTVAAVVFFLVGTAAPWVATRRLGLVPATGLLVTYLTAGLLWILTPKAVRQVIRRTDDLTGMRRGPNWRRPLVGGLVAAVVLAIPVDVPKTDNCDGRYQQACAEPIVAPTIDLPTFSIPPFAPPALPTLPAFPTFSPIPLERPQDTKTAADSANPT
jgi:hypothetical protein